MHAIQQVVVHVVVEGAIVLDGLGIERNRQRLDGGVVKTARLNGCLIELNIVENVGDVDARERTRLNLILINLVVVLNALLVQQANLAHLLNQTVDEEVDFLFGVADADDGDLWLRLVIVLIVGPPLQGNNVGVIQVSTDALKRVKRGPEFERAKELVRRRWREHE